MSGESPAREGSRFDPRPHLRRDAAHPEGYLDVGGRLLWLRAEQPAARVTTEHVVLDDHQAVFRATVELPDGARATGYGAASRDESEEFVERAEAKALGRALAVLGYGIQHTREFDLAATEAAESEPATATAAPRAPATPAIDRAAGRGQAATEPPPATEPPAARVSGQAPRMRVVHPPAAEPAEAAEAAEADFEPESEPEPEPQPERATRPEPERRRVAELAPERGTRPATRAVASVEETPLGEGEGEGEEFEPANYSWNEFWRWARPLGYRSRQALDDLLGVMTEEMTPREVRRLLLQYRAEHGEGD